MDDTSNRQTSDPPRADDTPQAPRSAASRGARIYRVIDLAGRFSLSLAILAIVFWGWQSVQEMRWGEEPQINETPDEPTAQLPSFAEFINGNWEFAGFPMKVQIREVSADRVMDEVNQPFEIRSSSRATMLPPLITPEDELTASLMASFLELFPFSQTTIGNRLEYRLDQPQLKAVAVAPQANPTLVEGIRFAYLSGIDEWSVVEALRVEQQATEVQAAANLMPLLAADRRIATRQDSEGRTGAELLAISGNLEDRIELWQSAGWTVIPNSFDLTEAVDSPQVLTEPETYSPSGEMGTTSTVLICLRETETVLAILVSGFESPQPMMLVIRSSY